MTLREGIDVGAMVGDVQVDKRVYTDQTVFDLEMERLFARTWVYAGHESQISAAGDFFTTEIGSQPVVVVRNKQHGIKAFYNRCPHRGAKLVTAEHGHTPRFVCQFHAYSFHTDGRLAGIPLEDSYADSPFGRCDPEMRLRDVGAVDNYLGFIFICLQPSPMPLDEWLGDTKVTLDNFVERSPEGEVEVVGRPYRWINRCNWKMLVENLIDGMHVGSTHPSTGQTADQLALRYEKNNRVVPPIVELARSFWQTNEFIRKMGITMLPNGHGYNGGQVSIHSDYSEINDYDAAMKASYGEEKARKILAQQRHNTAIYPNLHVKTMIQKIRVFRPIRPDKTIVECWVFRLKGAPPDLLQRTLTYAEMLDSPGSLVSTDDLEVMRRQQEGFASNGSQFVDFKRGVARPTRAEGTAVFCEGDSEQAFNRQFETWKRLMADPPDA